MSFPPHESAGDTMVVLLMIDNLHFPYKKRIVRKIIVFAHTLCTPPQIYNIHDQHNIKYHI